MGWSILNDYRANQFDQMERLDHVALLNTGKDHCKTLIRYCWFLFKISIAQFEIFFKILCCKINMNIAVIVIRRTRFRSWSMRETFKLHVSFYSCLSIGPHLWKEITFIKQRRKRCNLHSHLSKWLFAIQAEIHDYHLVGKTLMCRVIQIF